MTRILCSSDWHADHKTSGVDRYDDVAEAVAQTVRVAVEERVDLYLFTGDLCDPDDAPRALRAVALAVEAAGRLSSEGIESWWLAGNHDVVEDGSGRTTLSPLAALEKFRWAPRGGGLASVRVFERPAIEPLPQGRGRKAVLLPYPPATAPYDPRDMVRDSGPAVVMVAGHMTEVSWVGDDGEENREMSRGRGVPFPLSECDPSWLLVNGHFHHGRTVQCGEHVLHIPGSLVRLNHGEEKHRPRFLLLDL